MCAWEPASLQCLLLWIVWLLILASCCVQALKMTHNSSISLYFEDSIVKMCESDPLSDKYINYSTWRLRPSPVSHILLFRVTYESEGTTTCFFLSDVINPCHRVSRDLYYDMLLFEWRSQAMSSALGSQENKT